MGLHGDEGKLRLSARESPQRGRRKQRLTCRATAPAIARALRSGARPERSDHARDHGANPAFPGDRSDWRRVNARRTHVFHQATRLAKCVSVGAPLKRSNSAANASRLESTAMPLKTVAFDCGFASADRMRLAFVRRLGVSPAIYRSRFRERRNPRRIEAHGLEPVQHELRHAGDRRLGVRSGSPLALVCR